MSAEYALVGSSLSEAQRISGLYALVGVPKVAIQRISQVVALVGYATPGYRFRREEYTRGTAHALLRAPFDLPDGTQVSYGAQMVPDVMRPSESRVVSTGYYERTLSGDDGEIRVNTFRMLFADTDYEFRGFLANVAKYPLLNVACKVEVNSVENFWAGGKWLTYFRGEVSRYKPEPSLLFSLELHGWGTKQLARPIPLPKLVTDLPSVIDTSLYAPLLLGTRSDEMSATAAPTPAEEVARGVIDGDDWLAGFADGAGTAPTSPTLTENAAAGTLTAGLILRGYVVAYRNGVASSPAPFLETSLELTLVANGSAATLAWTAAVGGADYYRAFLAWVDTGAGNKTVWSQFIQTTGTSVQFTDVPAVYEPATEDLTPGAVRVDGEHFYWSMTAVMPDGETAPSVEFYGYTAPFVRPRRVVVVPVVGALHYHLYRRYVSKTQPNARFVVPVTNVNGDSNIYGEGTITGGAEVEGWPVARGRVPLAYAGLIADNEGTDWHAFVLTYGLGELIHLYQAPLAGDVPVRINEADYDTAIAVAGRGSQWTDQFQSRFGDYYQANGRRYTVIFVLGPQGDDAASGSRPLFANARGIEDVGDGTGDVIESGVDQLAWLLDNMVLPDTPQPVNGGDWLAPSTFSDGTPRRNATAFALADAEIIETLGSSDRSLFLPASASRPTNADVLRKMVLGLDVGFGWLLEGPVTIALHPPVPDSMDWAATEHDTDVAEAQNDPPFDVDDDPSPRVTTLPVRWHYHDADAAYLDEQLFDDTARPYQDQDAKLGSPLELETVTSATVAQAIGQRALLRRKKPQRTVTQARAFHGIHRDLGARFRVTHREGIGDGGYAEARMQVRRVLPSYDEQRVVHGCHDLDWIDLGE